ncbi:hypothetical protein [Micromonospora sp. NPDC002575]|uniref:hypothetical protein n=1 Tax=Micromonospora sp. NPDC002575 TaxID=3364222 RepID=UPI0036CDA62F
MDPNNKVRLAVAKNPSCPPAILANLAIDAVLDVRFAVLENPNADYQARQAICRSPDEDMRRLLAESNSVEEDIRNELLSDPSAAVRAGMAANTTAPHILAALIQDADAKVRAGAALNPLTSTEQRRRLARNKSASVRIALVQSVELAREDLEVLATDRSANVRWWVATVPGTPISERTMPQHTKRASLSTPTPFSFGAGRGVDMETATALIIDGL